MLELLIVVVVLGAVAAFVLPKFGDAKERAYVDAMRNDIRNYATEQEIYFMSMDAYASSPDGLDSFGFTEDVREVSSSGGADAFRLVVEHTQTDTRCLVKTAANRIITACGAETAITATPNGHTVDFSLDGDELASADVQGATLPLRLAGIAPLHADAILEGTVTWTFGDGTMMSGPALTHSDVSHTYASSGTYPVSAELEKPDGDVTFASTDVSVEESLQAAMFMSPNPADMDETVTLDGTGSSGAQSYAWEVWDGSSWLSLGSGSTYSFVPQSQAFPAGDTPIQLVVADGSGAADTTQQTLTVNFDAQMSISPNPAEASETVTLDGTGSTGLSGSSTYVWKVWTGSSWLQLGTGSTYSFKPSDENFPSGDNPIRLVFSDGNGNTDTAEDTLTVEDFLQANLRLDPWDTDGDGTFENSPQSGDDVTMDASGSTGFITEYVYEVYSGDCGTSTCSDSPVASAGPTSSDSWNVGPMPSGTYTFKLTVDDGGGNTSMVKRVVSAS